MKFTDLIVDKKNFFSMGKEEYSGKYYLSIPVSNRMIDYEEYYWITKDFFDEYNDNKDLVLNFAEECREYKHDEFLVFKPSEDRGVAK
ncbi:MAG: hypothetical protein ACNI28_02295 [Arcobacter sp.]|uniref:hypothetical protein n=1 Tax=Arcobacter sp. TaxID=1872629 RepID=UPI003B007CE9